MARSITGMRHPNILGVFDYGELDGGPYVVVAGQNPVSGRSAYASGSLTIRA